MKILFITHDTSRTGAPMVLLHLLKWLKEHKPEVQADLLALRGGAMEEDFIANSNDYINYKEVTKQQPYTFFQRLLKKVKVYKTEPKALALYNFLAKTKYDVVYANTIVSIPVAREIVERSKNANFIAHIHELNVVVREYVADSTDYFSNIDMVIVPSKLVAQNLIEECGIASHKIEVVYECAISQSDNSAPPITKKTFTVGASGAVHWRKGYDVFIQLARYIAKYYSNEPINFVWVGGFDRSTKIIIEEDLKKLGLTDSVTFTGEVEQPATHFKKFDVFAMTSREDPFPLVCIEVGQLGKPIISFDLATGINEVLLKGGGFIVPYLDVEAMAEKVMLYYNDPCLKETHGAINIKEFSKFTPDIICPKLFQTINKSL